MRRAAVFVLAGSIVLGAACTRSWVLNEDPTDGPAGAPDAGGTGGVGANDGGFGQGGHPFTGNPGGNCALTPVPRQVLTPDLLLAVGRNASMSSRYGDTTRIAAVQTTLHTLIETNQNAVNWGYEDFPALGGCSDPATCCISPQIIPSSNFQAADQAVSQCVPAGPLGTCVSPSDSRPVSPALAGAYTLFGSLPVEMNDRYVVLLVDGAPGCEGDDPMQASLAAAAQAAMLSRASSSVQTYVIEIGEDAAGDPGLGSIAQVGGSSPYQASGPDQLTKAMNSIMTAVLAAGSSCTVNLQYRPTDASKISVYFMGQQIPYDSSGHNGWNFAFESTTTLIISGSYCASVQSQPKEIVIDSGCSPCGANFPCF